MAPDNEQIIDLENRLMSTLEHKDKCVRNSQFAEAQRLREIENDLMKELRDLKKTQIS